MKICRNFQPVFTVMVEAFSCYKDLESAIEQAEKHGYNHGDFCLSWPTTSSLQWE